MFNFKSGQEVLIICGGATIRTTLDKDLKPIANITAEDYDMIPVPGNINQIMEVAEYLKNRESNNPEPKKAKKKIIKKTK